MGAWGMGTFDNDCAMDWMYELSESTGLSAIEEALESVLSADDYLEVDEGSAGLAAIEVLNTMRGKPPENVPDDVSNWVAANAGVDTSNAVLRAKEALAVIENAETSEVAGLWLDEGHDWTGLISDVRDRLNA